MDPPLAWRSSSFRAAGDDRTTEEMTVVIGVKKRVHALQWTIENVQSESSSWPWKPCGKVNLVVVRSVHVTPRLLSCCLTSLVSPCLLPSVREKREKASTRKAIEDVAAECNKRQVQLTVLDTCGDPRLKVLEVVEAMQAHVLVLGGHKYWGIRRLVLGSVAGSFMRYAKVGALGCHLVIVHKKKGIASIHHVVHREEEQEPSVKKDLLVIV